MFKKIILLFQIALVTIFIIFEEIIWESIATPIYRYFNSLNILKRAESFIKYKLNRYILLLIFILIFALVESAGVLAGILIVSGYPLVGFGIYVTKIPIATLTFWLFKVSKDKLISFRYFNLAYMLVIRFVEWIKSLKVYKSILKLLKKIKKYQVKGGKSSRFIRGIKRVYRVIKEAKKEG